jgi:ribosomal protein S18 acetylase RimI-like enzyme
MAEPVDDFLAHYGVKGMRWGKHTRGDTQPREKAKKYTETRSIKLKNGQSLELSGQKTPLPAKLIAAISPKFAKKLNDSHNFKLKSQDGKTVGEMYIYKKKPDEMNVVWVEVEEKHRGQGYASGAMQGAIDIARQQGLKKVTLEVPGISPDARHIYEKLGFKAGEQISSSNDMWGGLTEMQKDL